MRIGLLGRLDRIAAVDLGAIEVQVGGGFQGTQVNSNRHQRKQRMVHRCTGRQLLV